MNNISTPIKYLRGSLQGFCGAYVCLYMNKLIAFVAVAVVAPITAALLAAMTIALVLA